MSSLKTKQPFSHPSNLYQFRSFIEYNSQYKKYNIHEYSIIECQNKLSNLKNVKFFIMNLILGIIQTEMISLYRNDKMIKKALFIYNGNKINLKKIRKE